MNCLAIKLIFIKYSIRKVTKLLTKFTWFLNYKIQLEFKFPGKLFSIITKHFMYDYLEKKIYIYSERKHFRLIKVYL